MRKNFSQAQILQIVQEGEKGVSTEELLRKHGIAKSTYYKWKAKYGGISISDALRLKSLEEENTKLKRVVADLSPEALALEDILLKKE